MQTGFIILRMEDVPAMTIGDDVEIGAGFIIIWTMPDAVLKNVGNWRVLEKGRRNQVCLLHPKNNLDVQNFSPRKDW